MALEFTTLLYIFIGLFVLLVALTIFFAFSPIEVTIKENEVGYMLQKGKEPLLLEPGIHSIRTYQENKVRRRDYDVDMTGYYKTNIKGAEGLLDNPTLSIYYRLVDGRKWIMETYERKGVKSPLTIVKEELDRAFQEATIYDRGKGWLRLVQRAKEASRGRFEDIGYELLEVYVRSLDTTSSSERKQEQDEIYQRLRAKYNVSSDRDN